MPVGPQIVAKRGQDDLAVAATEWLRLRMSQ